MGKMERRSSWVTEQGQSLGLECAAVQGLPSAESHPGYPLQYSGLENSMDRGAWQATVPGFTKSQT